MLEHFDIERGLSGLKIISAINMPNHVPVHPTGLQVTKLLFSDTFSSYPIRSRSHYPERASSLDFKDPTTPRLGHGNM